MFGKDCFPFVVQGKSPPKTKVVACPEQGMELIQVQLFLERQKIFKGGFPSVVQGKSLSKIEQGTILNVVAFLENNCGCAFSDLSNQGRKPFHVILYVPHYHPVCLCCSQFSYFANKCNITHDKMDCGDMKEARLIWLQPTAKQY